MINKSIIEGSKIICPRCKTKSDLLSYIRLQEIEEFSNETAPVYKCSKCKWLFSLAGPMIQDVYRDLSEKIDFLLQNSNKDCDHV